MKSVSFELTGTLSPVEWDVWVEVLIALGVSVKCIIMNGAFVARSFPHMGSGSMALVHGS